MFGLASLPALHQLQEKLLLVTAQDSESLKAFRKCAAAADIVYVEGLHSAEAAGILAKNTVQVPTFVAFDSALELHALSRLGGLSSANSGCGPLP